MPQFNFDREEVILSVIIFAFFAVVTQNLRISIAVTIAAIYAVTMWFPNGASGLLAAVMINRSSDMTPQKLQEKFPALSLKKCEDFLELKVPESKIAEINDKNQKEIEAKVAGLIPTLEGNAKRDTPEVLNIVLLGKTGAGKSDTGNLILGKEGKFIASPATQSVTHIIKVQESTINGMRIRVCDTPGSIDTTRSEQAIASELLKIGMEFREGIHLFIFLKNMASPRFTEEETKAFEMIEKAFSKTALDHCIFMMSHADSMLETEGLREKTIEGYLKFIQKEDEKIDAKGNESVQAIYESVGNRVIAVENRPQTVYEKEAQRRFLIEYFKSTIEKAKNETFQHQAFVKANKKLQQLLGPYDDEVKEAVWAYLRDKTYEEIKELEKSEPATQRALREIVDMFPVLKGKERVIRDVFHANAQVLVDTTILTMLSGFACALFAGAGALIGGPALAVVAGTSALVTGAIVIVGNAFNFIAKKFRN